MKANNLIKLKENGFNVPKFDIIKWEDRNKEIDITKYKGKYAIRSSCNLEDNIENSFAGQFDTYLNIKDKDINKKVQDCFNSINNKNIIDYLNKKNINISNIKMDVIIQEMVESDYSGVLFTSNPNGLINESVIVVGKGLGNNIVEDKIDTTTYYYNITDNVYYYEGKKDYLNKESIEELINISNKLKEVFGDYLDIEYAIKNNKIFILQVRPITTLNTDNLLILDNSNIVESYPNISLPLTISFVEFVYTNVFKKEAYRLTKNQKLVELNNNNFNNMVGSSNGRLYYKISNWYTLIKFLPLSSKIIPIWQDMLGVKNKSYDNTKLKIPFTTRVKTYFNTITELHKVSKNMDILNNKFIEVNNYFNNNFNDDMTTSEIINLYGKVKKELLDVWDITLVNDLYSFIYTGMLKKRLKKKKLTNEKINDYISGISNIESLKPIKSIINLAYQKDKISKEEYNKLFNEYISLYGDRSLEELKLESETFRTNNKLLEDKIQEYRSDLNRLEEVYNNLNNTKNNTIKMDFITNFISKRAMTGIKNREISRLNRSRIYGMVRSMFIGIGNNLVKEKLLSNYKDIFYLKLEEVFDYKKYNLKDIVSERKKEYEMYYYLPNYSRLIFTDKEFDKHHKSINKKEKSIDKNILEGTPTSNGIIEGYALVIDNINKKYDTKDKILITKMTDPGWVFLLATAKGVISEKGSILSHTAIISREIKIPSIVGVEDATSIIKTGDYLKMNANTGKIEIVKEVRK